MEGRIVEKDGKEELRMIEETKHREGAKKTDEERKAKKQKGKNVLRKYKTCTNEINVTVNNESVLMHAEYLKRTNFTRLK